MIFVHIHFSSISRLPRIDTEPLRLLIQDSLYDDGSDDADDEEDNDLKISSETAPTTETAEAGRVKDNSLAAENVKDILDQGTNVTRRRRDLGIKNKLKQVFCPFQMFLFCVFEHFLSNVMFKIKRIFPFVIWKKYIYHSFSFKQNSNLTRTVKQFFL